MLIVAIAAALSIADAFLKHLALATRTPNEPFTVLIPSLLRFGLHQNRGAIANIPLGQPLILALSLVIIVCLIALAKQQWCAKNARFVVASMVVLLGAINNFTDRLLHGFTTDYFLLGPWSLVNVSDGLILVGLVWLIIEEWRAPATPT